MADTNNINPDTDNIIPDGLRADVMRNKMENKEALRNPGDIYIGTGQTTEITVGDKIYKIPKTIGKNLKDAILEFGQIDSYPLSDALKPISISSKDQLVNTNTTLTELAKKSFAYTVSDSPVKLQDADAANNKEEVIIPAWSKGMVLSSGNDLLVTYGSNTDFSGSFFYDQSKTKWTIVKANIASILDAETMKTTNDGLIPKTSSVNLGSNDNRFKTIYANILDSETMKTTNDGLIPKTTESVNLGSGNNLFNTVYAKYFSIPGQCLNFRYDSDTAVIEGNALDVRFGYDCFRPNGERLPIDEYLFMNGGGVDDEAHLTWIRPKGITPYNNNEVNFNIKEDADSLVFGRQGSKKTISRYDFKDGKNNTFVSIGRGTTSVINRDPDHPAENLDATYSYEFAVPKMVGKDYVDLGNNIYLATYTKGATSSSGNDCAMWACDTTKGRFLFKNNGSWSVLPVEAPSFNATSDKRLKENIIPFTSEKSILDLPVYTFNFKSDKNKKKHVGCLAQDLQEICPDLVNEDSQGYLSIEESKITYLLLEEVKELKKQVEELKGKINELEGK